MCVHVYVYIYIYQKQVEMREDGTFESYEIFSPDSSLDSQ